MFFNFFLNRKYRWKKRGNSLSRNCLPIAYRKNCQNIKESIIVDVLLRNFVHGDDSWRSSVVVGRWLTPMVIVGLQQKPAFNTRRVWVQLPRIHQFILVSCYNYALFGLDTADYKIGRRYQVGCLQEIDSLVVACYVFHQMPCEERQWRCLPI